MKLLACFFVTIGFFIFLSCGTSHDEVRQIISGNTFVMESGTKVRLINVADSPRNYKRLNNLALFERVMIVDSNYKEVDLKSVRYIDGLVFIKNQTCLNDLLEKEGINISDAPITDDFTSIPTDVDREKDPVSTIPQVALTDVIHWSQKHVTSTKEVSECYEYVQGIFYKQNIKSLPHIPVLLITRKEMFEKTGSSNVLGVAYNERAGVEQLHVINIVNNLPKLDFAGVLAHEILHTWINQNNIQLDMAQKEGFCNYGEYLIFKSVGSEYGGNLIDAMMRSSHPWYGVGFREVKEKVETVGLDVFMRELLMQ